MQRAIRLLTALVSVVAAFAVANPVPVVARNNGPSADGVVVWSNRAADGSEHLLIARADGSHQKNLTFPAPDPRDADAQISPDGPEPAKDRPLGPTTVQVRGRQFPVDAEQGSYSMLGDLIGRWTVRSAPGSAGYSIPETPWTRVETGQEWFVGCLDRNYSQRCDTGEPSGALSFNYTLWKQYDPDFGWLIKGKCLHSITGGSGDFTGARGVLLMYRGPAGRGEEVNSIYKGEIALNAIPNEQALQNDDAPAGSAVRTASC